MYTDRKYYGDLYVVNGDVLSKFAKKKLALTQNWGFVKVIEEKLDKLVIDVFYLDFPYYNHQVNFVSTEVVDKEDISLLDWNMVRYMYNIGVKYIVENYLQYIELFDIKSIGWFEESKWYIFRYPGNFKSSKEALKEYDNYWQCHEEGTAWMFDQIESGKIDIKEYMKELKKHYKYV